MTQLSICSSFYHQNIATYSLRLITKCLCLISCCFLVSFTFIYFVTLALCKSFYFCHCLSLHIIFRYFCIFLLLHLRLTTGYKSFCSIDGLLHSISHINLEACVLSSLLYMHHWFCNFSNSFILPISATAVGSTSTSTDTTFF